MSSRFIQSMMARRISSTDRSMPLRCDRAWRRNWRTETPGNLLGVLEGEEDARLAPHIGTPVGDVVAVVADRPGVHAGTRVSP